MNEVILFITTDDIKQYSFLNGNIDNNKIIQYIKIAQDIHIENILGTKLTERLEEEIRTDSLTPECIKILNKYIKPMLIHFAQVEILPYIAYTVANGGVYKHHSENAESVDVRELDSLIEKENSIASSYATRFTEFMCNNQSSCPEYYTNSGSDLQPDKDTVYSPFVLRKTNINLDRLGGYGYNGKG